MIRSLTLLLLLLLGGMSILWANDSSKFFENVREQTINASANGTRYIVPQTYRSFEMNVDDLRQYLINAPEEFSTESKQKTFLLSIPMPDGTDACFAISKSSMMHPQLAAKYPQIKTYSGQGIDDPTATMRFSVTQNGFRAMILSGLHGAVYIDNYFHKQDRYYISYFKKDYVLDAPKHEPCLVHDIPQQRNDHWHDGLDIAKTIDVGEGPGTSSSLSDGFLREYRTVFSATGEYTSFHGGTVADGLAAIVETINRINEVYERDFAIRFELIANNDDVIYTNGSTDPYSNNNAGALINESQTNIDAIIGSANYDLGHTVSTGGGGLAGLGVVCLNGNKASGITGSGSPVGDPFDIDYVAHEVGHQFGGSHTFNGNDGACGGNRSANSAYEPGSGTTIQAYAGICSSHNIQSNSDDHFHARSLLQMSNYAIFGGSGDSCPNKTATGNSAPTSDAGADYVIPTNTPFELRGTGSDPDGDAITYCWEQYDLGPEGGPNSPSGNAPLFRSFSPTVDNIRICPQISDIVNNTQTIGELLPSYDRNMVFRLTVRDNHAGAGCTTFDDMEIDVEGSAGPFEVIAPNTALTWEALTTETVTWDVAGTNSAPVSCANVDILMSTDGGYTYPVTVATAVPNTGSASITVPNNVGSNNRIKVICSDNIFFDISNTNFTITPASTPDFLISANPPAAAACPPSDAVFSIDLDAIAGFSSSVSFSVSGVPAGATSNFSPSTVTPTGSTTLTIGNAAAATPGTYNLTVTATGGGSSKTTDLTLAIGFPGDVVLTSPANGAEAVALATNFTWAAAAGATDYEIQIATDAAFTNVVESATVASTSYSSAGLSVYTVYFWRVRATNGCGNGDYSSLFSFRTDADPCSTIASADIPVNLPEQSSPGNEYTVTSSLNWTNGGTIDDLNVLGLDIDHTWVNDLEISLTSPNGTTVSLIDSPCGDENDVSISFDDEASSASFPCPPNDGNTYQANGNLSDFDGENANGTWTLSITDTYASEDGGSLNAWSIEICVASGGTSANADPVVVNNSGMTVGTGTTTAITPADLQSTDADDNNADLIYTLTSLPANGTLYLSGSPLSVGSTFTQGDIDSGLVTYGEMGGSPATDSFDFVVTDPNGGYTAPHTFTITITGVSTTTYNVGVTFILEGDYDPTTGLMRTDLLDAGLIPINQPYNAAPWNYTGSEAVANINAIPDDVVDWVLVELMDGSFNTIDRAAGFLRNDGTLLATDGSTGVDFTITGASSDYYIAVRHRHHLDVLSAAPVNLATAAPYDMTTASSVLSSPGNDQLKDLGGGLYALHAGDINGDGVITVLDLNIYITQSSLIFTYVNSDCNMDSNVTVADYNLFNANSGKIGASFIQY